MASWMRTASFAALSAMVMVSAAAAAHAGDIPVQFFLVPERMVCSGEIPFTGCAPISTGCDAAEQSVCADKFVQKMSTEAATITIALRDTGHSVPIKRSKYPHFFQSITEYVDGPEAPHLAVVVVFNFSEPVPHRIEIVRDHEVYPARKVRREQGNRYFYWMNARFMHFEERSVFTFTFDGAAYTVWVDADR